MMARNRIYLALLVLWVALTFLLTSIPNPRMDIQVPFFDKLIHLCFYGVIGLLCALWRRESGEGVKASFLVGFIFATSVGAVDEIHQYWIPGRSTEFFDWIADSAGGFAGALFSAFLPRFFPFLLTE